MNKRKLILLIIVIFLTIGLSFFVNANDTEPKLTFSNESGFYDEPFYLTINSNIKGTIYYTLDGSDPDKNSLVYSEPLYIYDASENENVYSARNDTSAGFFSDFVDQYCRDNPHYEVPCYKVDKCTIIKAYVEDEKGRQSSIETKSYFVSFDKKSGYEGMNIISIITNPDNLFDYYDGIYTTGAVFRENMESMIENEIEDAYWEHIVCNYSRDVAQKKDAICQIFVDGENVLTQACDINIHGGGSRGFNQKSFNIFSKNTNGIKDKFEYDFFGTGFYPTSFTLSNGGDDNSVKLIDYTYSRMYQEGKCSTMHYEPYVLFLDGEYWGFYWLTEKYDETFCEYYYGISENNTIIYKNFLLEVGKNYDINYYTDLLYFCQNSDLNAPGAYDEIDSMIDIDSFIDYYSSLIYVGRCGDWPNGNVALWRSRKVGNGELEDGKWRWMVFDVNSYAMSYEVTLEDNYSTAFSDDEIFNGIMQNDEIREKFLERLEYFSKVFSYENACAVLDDVSSKIEVASNKSNKRFWGDKSSDYFSKGVEEMKYFFENRGEFINQLIEDNK